MDSETESNNSYNPSDEDTFGCYFLQPSRSPYNMIEKVHEANMDLYKSSMYLKNDKSVKVTFRDDVVLFEHDLTDYDVNSIESENEEISLVNNSLPERKAVYNDTDLPTPNIINEVGSNKEGIVEKLGGINNGIVNTSTELIHQSQTERPVINIGQNINQTRSALPVLHTKTNKICAKLHKTKITSSHIQGVTTHINCKDHCIDKLDCNLKMSIKKLKIHEEKIPPLQFLQRKCCIESKKYIQRNLPQYNGLISEYGMSSKQLKELKEQRELIKSKEKICRRLCEEYKEMKIQQNEEVYAQWLKKTSTRKNGKSRARKRTKINNSATKVRQKPSKYSSPELFISKPHMFHACEPIYCIYIQIPRETDEELIIGNSTAAVSSATAN